MGMRVASGPAACTTNEVPAGALTTADDANRAVPCRVR
jgi:hypothetical protein